MNDVVRYNRNMIRRLLLIAQLVSAKCCWPFDICCGDNKASLPAAENQPILPIAPAAPTHTEPADITDIATLNDLNRNLDVFPVELDLDSIIYVNSFRTNKCTLEQFRNSAHKYGLLTFPYDVGQPYRARTAMIEREGSFVKAVKLTTEPLATEAIDDIYAGMDSFDEFYKKYGQFRSFDDFESRYKENAAFWFNNKPMLVELEGDTIKQLIYMDDLDKYADKKVYFVTKGEHPWLIHKLSNGDRVLWSQNSLTREQLIQKFYDLSAVKVACSATLIGPTKNSIENKLRRIVEQNHQNTMKSYDDMPDAISIVDKYLVLALLCDKDEAGNNKFFFAIVQPCGDGNPIFAVDFSKVAWPESLFDDGASKLEFTGLPFKTSKESVYEYDFTELLQNSKNRQIYEGGPGTIDPKTWVESLR